VVHHRSRVDLNHLQQSVYGGSSGPYVNNGGNLFWFNNAASVDNATTSTPETRTTNSSLGITSDDCLVVCCVQTWGGPGTAQVPIASVADQLGNNFSLAITQALTFGGTATRTQMNWARIPGGISNSYNVSAVTTAPIGTYIFVAVSVFNSKTIPIASTIRVDTTNTDTPTIPLSVGTFANYDTTVIAADIDSWGFFSAAVVGNSASGNFTLASGQPTNLWTPLLNFGAPNGTYWNSGTQQIVGIGPNGSYAAPLMNGLASEIVNCSMTLTRY